LEILGIDRPSSLIQRLRFDGYNDFRFRDEASSGLSFTSRLAERSRGIRKGNYGSLNQFAPFLTEFIFFRMTCQAEFCPLGTPDRLNQSGRGRPACSDPSSAEGCAVEDSVSADTRRCRRQGVRREPAAFDHAAEHERREQAAPEECGEKYNN